MKLRRVRFLCLAATLLLAVSSMGQTVRLSKESKTMHATGTFQVKVQPTEASEIGKAAALGRMTIDKVWSGGIEGTSQGEMTTSSVEGAMAYVALEKVTAKIDGHSGSFVFMHSATMMASDPASGFMTITVMPNSGTGSLKGIQGKLTIVIDKSGHSYDFEYSLPQS
jgi:hypothetical protein